MNLFALEGNMEGLGVLIFGIFFVGFGVPIILGIIGLVLRSKGKTNSSKVLLIIAGIYLLVSLGICGSMMM